MSRKIILLMIGLLILGSDTWAQEETSVSESRKKSIMKLMDYRYQGGFYSFEKLFNEEVKYPENLQKECIMGIVILSFKVDCNGVLTELSIKNSISEMLNMELSKFMEKTRGHWNECKDDKYTRFEIPVQFKVEETKTSTENAVLICVGTSAGFVCNSDDYYIGKAKKLMEKGKGKKAMKFLDILIKRDPYNMEFYDLKKKALEMMK
jgi:TonB family protein